MTVQSKRFGNLKFQTQRKNLGESRRIRPPSAPHELRELWSNPKMLSREILDDFINTSAAHYITLGLRRPTAQSALIAASNAYARYDTDLCKNHLRTFWEEI